MPTSAKHAVILCWTSLLLTGSFAAAQAIRVARPAIIKPELEVNSLSITVDPTSVSFQLQAGATAVGNTTLNITTSWGGNSNCKVTRVCTINLYGYFSSATAALAGGSPVVDIPTSEVFGVMATGLPTTYTAFTQSGPFGGSAASLELYSYVMTTLTKGDSRTDPLNLEINLANQPQLPAGIYTGTLSLIAETF